MKHECPVRISSSTGKGLVMKIAIPVWGNKVSPVFDAASSLLVVNFENRREVSRLAYHIGAEDLLSKCHRIESLAPDVIICGAISHFFLNMLKAADIDVIEDVSGRIDEILEAYLKGEIFNSRFLMPGCQKRGYICSGRKKFRKHKMQFNTEELQ